jgi:hypothetical protein
MVTVALIGLGAMGSEIVRYLIEKKHELAAVIDNDPSKVGRTVREIIGFESEVRIQRSVKDVEFDNLDVAVFSTKSRLSELADEIEYVAMRGVDVVTTCEELAYPPYASEVLAAKLDSVAREKGVTVVGVGVNPGFVMDWVPSLVASASKNPKSVHVVRSVDVSKRRRQLQTKAGVGLTKGRFEKGLRDGALGHVGLEQSAHLIAFSLGEKLEGLKSAIFPVVGSDDYVMGVRQFAEGRAGVCVIRLDLEMTITSADFDVIEVKGEPNIKLRFENGVFGDSATVALTVNAVERVGGARPGLITVLELPLVSLPARSA